MESRKITIVSTKTQSKKVIMSEAETLAELKNDLNANGIDYTDMTFYEGLSKVELLDDTSRLPKDVTYTNRTTGETKTTNELVFMLTNTNKKIKSGISSLRQATYVKLREMNLQGACIQKYGKNYTQCSTNDLMNLIEENTVAECANTEYTNIAKALELLADILYEEDVLTYMEYKQVVNTVKGVPAENEVVSSYSDSEIDDMFASFK